MTKGLGHFGGVLFDAGTPETSRFAEYELSRMLQSEGFGSQIRESNGRGSKLEIESLRNLIL